MQSEVADSQIDLKSLHDKFNAVNYISIFYWFDVFWKLPEA